MKLRRSPKPPGVMLRVKEACKSYVVLSGLSWGCRGLFGRHVGRLSIAAASDEEGLEEEGSDEEASE